MMRRICSSALTVALLLLGTAHAQERETRGEAASQAGPGKDAGKAPAGSGSSAAARKTLDAEKRALDLMLAETLTDPLSAIQYRVSSHVVACNDVLAPQHSQDWNGAPCLCYEVNTRGASNAYQGRKADVAVLRTAKEGTPAAAGLLIKTDDRRMWDACSAARWEKRPFKFIHEQVY